MSTATKDIDPWYQYETTDMSRWIQPKDITRKDWTFLLGMSEMEYAAKRILELAQQRGQWHRVGIDDMADDRQRVGFVELVYSQLLDKRGGSGWCAYCYNGTFTPSKRLIEIMAKPERQPLRQEDIA